MEGGFNKVQIKDGDQHKAAFKTKHGLYEPLVMCLGLIVGPGPHRLPAGIPVGIPAGILTRRSGSP